MQLPKTTGELRESVRMEQFGTNKKSATVNASLKTVLTRVTKNANECMHYTYTITGGGKVQYEYTPSLKWISKKEASLELSLRFRQKSGLVNNDDTGYTFVADMKEAAKNKTQITTYSNGAASTETFHDAVIFSAQGRKDAPCPAEI